jgi:dihydropteroate synthase
VPARELMIPGGIVQLGEAPLVMGIVNATPDSFSDGGVQRTLEERVELARSMVRQGAAIIDVGGESAVTNRPAVSAETEIERVVPLIERLSSELDVLVSVDTYKPAVARAAVAAGASIINDISGLRDPDLARVSVETGAALVLMHTRAAPKQKLLDRALDGRALEDVKAFLAERIELALGQGIERRQLMLDPGPDFSKTPAQTLEVLRGLAELHELGCPLLLAVSRKDFVGAITRRPPRSRLPGTLAAISHGVKQGAHVLRVHDVAATVEFLTVAAALRGELSVAPDLRLPDELRWEQTAS